MIVVLPLLLILTVGALYFFNYTQSMSSGLRYVTLKSQMHEHANIVFENVSKHLGLGASPCLNLDPFYAFSAMAPVNVKIDSLDVLKSCFIGDSSMEIYDQFSLELARIPSAQDASIGETSVRAVLKLRTRNMTSVPVLKLDQEKVYNVKISSLARFTLFFRGVSGPLIKIPVGAKLWVYGDVMKGGADSLKLNSLSSPSYINGGAEFEFLGKFFTHGPLEIFEDGVAEKVLSVFKGGVFPGAMSEFLDIPSMDASPVWNQDIDYHYVYKGGMGYPLPSSIPSAHGAGENVVDATLAAVKNFPHPDIIDDLSQTCESSTDPMRGDVKPMIIYQKDSDVSLDLTNGKLFCGFVIAKTLKVKIADDQVSGLIGHFNVANLVIEGNGRLYILNPFSVRDTPEDLSLPAGMNLSEVARQLYAQKASIAKNFFLPFFKSTGGVPSVMKPVALTSFFESCGSNYCWKPDIQILDYSSLYAQPGWYKNVRFFVDKTF